jgi:hypothetical protein
MRHLSGLANAAAFFAVALVHDGASAHSTAPMRTLPGDGANQDGFRARDRPVSLFRRTHAKLEGGLAGYRTQ